MAAITSTSNAVILQKLIDLETSIKRVEDKVDQIDNRVQAIERNDARSESVVLKVEDHEDRLRALEKLAPTMRVVVWIAGVLGVSVIGLIWALITGQAVLAFK
jgi:hypothetical protein